MSILNLFFSPAKGRTSPSKTRIVKVCRQSPPLVRGPPFWSKVCLSILNLFFPPPRIAEALPKRASSKHADNPPAGPGSYVTLNYTQQYPKPASSEPKASCPPVCAKAITGRRFEGGQRRVACTDARIGGKNTFFEVLIFCLRSSSLFLRSWNPFVLRL